MRASSIWVALIGAVVLGAGHLVSRQRPAHLRDAQRITIPADSVARFAACMGWKPVTASRIARIPHYVRHDAVPDTLGATNGTSWVWVAADAPDRWMVLRHEWVHVYSQSPAHVGPQWANAFACGGPAFFL